MRGEYAEATIRRLIAEELPPRARRIPCMTYNRPATAGTTSACAENTKPQPRSGVKPWNYLRVRGEYKGMVAVDEYTLELPPRARRILSLKSSAICFLGTTSACAENTPGAFCAV